MPSCSSDIHILEMTITAGNQLADSVAIIKAKIGNEKVLVKDNYEKHPFIIY